MAQHIQPHMRKYVLILFIWDLCFLFIAYKVNSSYHFEIWSLYSFKSVFFFLSSRSSWQDSTLYKQDFSQSEIFHIFMKYLYISIAKTCLIFATRKFYLKSFLCNVIEFTWNLDQLMHILEFFNTTYLRKRVDILNVCYCM